MTDIEVYTLFDDEIRKTYREQKLKHLNEIEISGQFPPGIFSEILRKKNPVHKMPYSHFKMVHEIDFITCDMKYITAQLYLLRPYINNPIVEGNTYQQSVCDRRYLMHVTFGLQAVYNFWDRIGDILWHYFETNLSERDVYFDRVIKQIEEKYKETDSYKRLIEIYEKEVKPILKERSESVHYFQPEVRHYWGHVENNREIEKVKEMYQLKFGYADMMKRQLEIALIVFEETLKLIEERPDKS